MNFLAQRAADGYANSAEEPEIHRAFLAGVDWGMKHIPEELIKRIIDLSYEYISSDPDVTTLTEEGELEYVKKHLISRL